MTRSERELIRRPITSPRRALLLEPASLEAFWMHHSGFEVSLAADADDLIVRAITQRPDVIVLSGPQAAALRLIRTIPSLRPIPVLQLPRGRAEVC